MLKSKNVGKIMRIFALFVSFLFIISLVEVQMPDSAAASPINQDSFLKVDGKLIRDHSGTGQQVDLHGTNAGGWLVQEQWMTPSDQADSLTMRSTLTNRFGEAAKDDLINAYEDSWWTTSDFDNIKNLGMNVVRLPFTYLNLLDGNGNLKSNAWNRLDWFVNNASSRGLYVILDMHGAPGSQNGADHSGDSSGSHLYDNQANMDKTVWLWEQIANRYKGNPAVAAYDLLNEPTGASGTTQYNFYDRLYDAVRAIDSDHIIMIESTWDPADLPNPAQYGWTNIVYEYHFYCWGADNDAATQKSFTDSKVSLVNNANYNVPLLVGEFTLFNSLDAWDYALGVYNAHDWNWTTWSYKVNTGSASNWGLYNSNAAKPHLGSDSYASIMNNWSHVDTASSFYSNTGLQNIISSRAQEMPNSGTKDAYSQIEAENYDSMSGIQTESSSEGGQDVGWTDQGDYIAFNNVDFASGATGLGVRVASGNNGGNIEIRLDSVSGALAGTCAVSGTGGWQNWTTNTCAISGASGVHNLYLKFVGAGSGLLNINWFKFTTGTVPTPPGAGIVSGTTYTVVSKASGKALDVQDWSTSDGGNIQQWTSTGGANQQFKVEDVGGGYYKITNVNSGKALDVQDVSTSDGANIQQWTYGGGANQQWEIVEVGGGYYKIVSKNSGKVVEVSGSSTANGANIQQWTDHGGANQQWSFQALP